jgi:hypothetical protein
MITGLTFDVAHYAQPLARSQSPGRRARGIPRRFQEFVSVGGRAAQARVYPSQSEASHGRPLPRRQHASRVHGGGRCYSTHLGAGLGLRVLRMDGAGRRVLQRFGKASGCPRWESARATLLRRQAPAAGGGGGRGYGWCPPRTNVATASGPQVSACETGLYAESGRRHILGRTCVCPLDFLYGDRRRRFRGRACKRRSSTPERKCCRAGAREWHERRLPVPPGP